MNKFCFKDLKEFPETVKDEIGYTLHCIQKKSKCGIATPKKEIEVVNQKVKWLKQELQVNT